jgi:penicillin-binding protein 1A
MIDFTVTNIFRCPHGGVIVSGKKRWCFLFLGAGIFVMSLPFLFWPLPDVGSGFNYVVVVHSADGGELAEFYKERRVFVPGRDIPERVKKVFLAAEDQSFYSHHGFEVKGILRALRKNIAANSVVEGGSTITQQLAKMLIKNPERSFSRKLHEMIIAIKLEGKYSKDEILAAYLNLAYFGERVYGIEAAARAYFNKSVGDLSTSEAALLAGILKAPSAYSPLRSPALARERMKAVLDEMLSLKFISADEYAAALSSPLPQSACYQRRYNAPYFIDFTRQQLSAKYGEAVYEQGFHVFSTIDVSMQALAEKVVREGVRQIALRTRPGVQAALVAMDISTGEIKAMAGGTDYSASQFNRATMALRQPGSAFKPFVYAAAFRKGMSYNDSILDEPVSIREPDTGRWWTPRNSEGEYYGDVSLKTAFALSLNSATVRLAQRIGFDSVREMAEQCGITTKLNTHPSIALGSSEVTLMDLTAAYAVLATGRKVMPVAYTLIRDKRGKVVEHSVPSYQEILSPDIVDKMRVLLRATIESGIAGGARRVNRLVYGKTGTTNDYSDAWFVGFDDRLALGVWVGRDDHSPLGIEETGSETALPIWVEYMKHVKY